MADQIFNPSFNQNSAPVPPPPSFVPPANLAHPPEGEAATIPTSTAAAPAPVMPTVTANPSFDSPPIAPAPETTAAPQFSHAPTTPTPPAPPLTPKTSGDRPSWLLPAVIGGAILLLAVVGLIIYFALQSSTPATRSTPTPLPTNNSSLGVDPTIEANLATSAAGLLSETLDQYCNATASAITTVSAGSTLAQEQISLANLPVTFSPQALSIYGIAVRLNCYGQPKNITNTNFDDSRYLFAHSDLGQLYLVHSTSVATSTVPKHQTTVFDFPSPAICDRSNSCHVQADGSEIFFLPEEKSDFNPKSLCVQLSRAGQVSPQEDFVVKAYVQDCLNPSDGKYPTLLAVYNAYGQVAADGSYRFNAPTPESETAFLKALTGAYELLPNYQTLQDNLDQVITGIAFK